MRSEGQGGTRGPHDRREWGLGAKGTRKTRGQGRIIITVNR
ncbi:hypothetical protein [Chroococcidiopsis cubana]|nr:hypothetical protein [Chroococcidiopsis cubana]